MERTTPDSAIRNYGLAGTMFASGQPHHAETEAVLAVRYASRVLALIALLLAASAISVAASNFVTVTLPRGVSIEIPNDWVVLSGNQRVTLDKYVESVLDISGNEKPNSDLAIAAHNYDDHGNTVGILNIRYYPTLTLSQADARRFTDSDVRDLDAVLRQDVLKVQEAFGMSLTSWTGTTKTEINGITTFITEYRRGSRNGPNSFRVRLVRVLDTERSFTLTASYLETPATMTLGPITDRIIGSLKLAGIAATTSPAATSGASATPEAYSIMSDIFGEPWPLMVLLSGLFTWGIGLAPPLIIRYALLKRPLNKWPAIGTCAGFWFLNVVLFTALGSRSKTHVALTLVAFVSYWILRKPARGEMPVASVPSTAQMKWPTSRKWFVSGVAAVLSLGGLWFGYSRFAGPEAVSQYVDLSIGDSMQQVLYVKGLPTDVVGDWVAASSGQKFRELIPLGELPAGRKVTDYYSWSYMSPGAGSSDVEFSPKTQRLVRVACFADVNGSCPALLGIAVGTSEEEVIDRLGEPGYSEISSGFRVTKEIRYPERNVAYLLEKRKVYGLVLGSRADSSGQNFHALTDRSSREGWRPPAECAKAQSADECADILLKAGKNQFDAFPDVGSDFTYGVAAEAQPPPCKNGTSNCKPWERDWGNRRPVPGTAVPYEDLPDNLKPSTQ